MQCARLGQLKERLCLASLTTSLRRADNMLRQLENDNGNHQPRGEMDDVEASGRGRQQEGSLDPQYTAPRSHTITAIQQILESNATLPYAV